MGSLVFVNVPTDNLQKSKEFYRQLFGIELARNLTHAKESYHLPVASNDVRLLITPRYNPKEPILCYYAVDSIDATLAKIQSLGGKKAVDKFDIPLAPEAIQEYDDAVKRRGGAGGPKRGSHTMGKALIAADPDGNHFGIVELEEHAKVFFRLKPRHMVDKSAMDEHNQAIANGKAFEAKLKGGKP